MNGTKSNNDRREAESGFDATLSPHRAFVVHFARPAGPGQPPCAGRVEHVSSGATIHFRSWQELVDFVADACEAKGEQR
jgi:hypothetical protein